MYFYYSLPLERRSQEMNLECAQKTPWFLYLFKFFYITNNFLKRLFLYSTGNESLFNTGIVTNKEAHMLMEIWDEKHKAASPPIKRGSLWYMYIRSRTREFQFINLRASRVFTLTALSTNVDQKENKITEVVNIFVLCNIYSTLVSYLHYFVKRLFLNINISW